MFATLAHAAGAQPGGAAGAEGNALFSLVIPMVLMFGVFYFLLIRPQQKRAKQHREMLNAIKKGDHVITSGGLLGRVVDIEQNDIMVVDLGDSKVRTPRAYVTGTYDPKALEKVAAEAPGAGK